MSEKGRRHGAGAGRESGSISEVAEKKKERKTSQHLDAMSSRSSRLGRPTCSNA